MTKTANRIGLAVMDIQTLHRGHNNLLNEMRMTCSSAVIGIGSIRKSGSPGHPFTFEQRAEMVRTIHGDFFGFVPLDDIDASHDMRAWFDYVKAKIEKAGLPQPTDYFGGSQIDAKWYFHAFASPEHQSVPQAGSNLTFANVETGRRLHLIDRKALGLPSGREVRLLIETRDSEWQRYVPERLHAFIEQNYPPHLRQPIVPSRVDWEPRDPTQSRMAFATRLSMEEGIRKGEVELHVHGEHPVGTRLCTTALVPGGAAENASSMLLELKDDGRWRPLETRDEKAEWALASKKGN